MWNRIKHWWRAEGALVHLQGISDRQLADMGLEREGLRQRVLEFRTEAPAPAPAFRRASWRATKACQSAPGSRPHGPPAPDPWPSQPAGPTTAAR
jgi:hypothetical protein